MSQWTNFLFFDLLLIMRFDSISAHRINLQISTNFLTAFVSIQFLSFLISHSDTPYFCSNLLFRLIIQVLFLNLTKYQSSPSLRQFWHFLRHHKVYFSSFEGELVTYIELKLTSMWKE